MSTLSVMTICQDEEHVIKWYLECCAHLTATLPDLKEIIIVDGGSKDNTIDIINSYKDKAPIKLLERPWDYTRAQMNFGVDQCTGDYIFVPDADMTWTTNLGQVFSEGWFKLGNMWDFPMLFTAIDAYHYFNWPLGVNLRMFKRGIRYKEDRKYHVQLEGQTPGIPVCGKVIIFENSCRIKDDKALMWRGERRQVCVDDMALEGASPGAPDRFLNAAKTAEQNMLPMAPHVIPFILPSTNG